MRVIQNHADTPTGTGLKKQKAVLRQPFELFAQKKCCLEKDGGNGFLSTMLVLKDTDNGRTKMVLRCRIIGRSFQWIWYGFLSGFGLGFL